MSIPLETFEQLQGFFWILVRVSTLFFLLPLFGARNIPSLWKTGLSFVIAIVLAPVVPAPVNSPVTAPGIIVGVLGEVLMGFRDSGAAPSASTMTSGVSPLRRFVGRAPDLARRHADAAVQPCG